MRAKLSIPTEWYVNRKSEREQRRNRRKGRVGKKQQKSHWRSETAYQYRMSSKHKIFISISVESSDITYARTVLALTMRRCIGMAFDTNGEFIRIDWWLRQSQQQHQKPTQRNIECHKTKWNGVKYPSEYGILNEYQLFGCCGWHVVVAYRLVHETRWKKDAKIKCKPIWLKPKNYDTTSARAAAAAAVSYSL